MIPLKSYRLLLLNLITFDWHTIVPLRAILVTLLKLPLFGIMVLLSHPSLDRLELFCSLHPSHVPCIHRIVLLTILHGIVFENLSLLYEIQNSFFIAQVVRECIDPQRHFLRTFAFVYSFHLRFPFLILRLLLQ